MEKSNEMSQGEIRRLAAIMFTDIVGFSRQMGADESRTLRLLALHNQIIRQAVAAYNGTVIKIMGDAFLVDFPSVVNAVQCAQQIQAQFRAHNAEHEPAEQIHVRIGIHLGDIVQQEGDVFGDGVNVASRLQGLAEPDTICISHIVYTEIEKKLPLGAVVPLGQPKLKNIVQRQAVYLLLPEAPKAFRQRLQVQRLKLSRRVRPAQHLALAGLLLIVGTLLAVRYLPFSSPTTQPPIPGPPALPLPDKPSIVILPLVNMSNDPEQDYFSDGITEDITSDLSRISSLFVIARNSAFTYKGKAVKVQDVSKEMGVRYVLEGSVRKADNQVRITAQLVDATTGGHIWTERYDRPFKDIFALQDEIRHKIVFALKVKLTLEEQERFKRAPTNSLEAYDYYLRGVEFFLRAQHETKKEANVQARQMYDKALELDPQYAAAYAGLGWSYWFDWFYQWNPDRLQSLERAFELTQRAITLDESLSRAHALLGYIYLFRRQYQQGIAEAERAVVLGPSDAQNYAVLGVSLVYAGRKEEGVRFIEKAVRLNPRHAVYLGNLGWAYRAAGRYEEALAPLKQALTFTPDFQSFRANLAACYAELGQLEEARAEMAEALRLNPAYSLEALRQTLPYKDPADLERFLEGLRKAGLK